MENNKIIGYLDEVTNKYISGWAVNKEDTNVPVEVKIHINGYEPMIIKADRFRVGLKNKGIHPNGIGGFRLELEQKLDISLDTEIKVFAGENNIPLKNSPWVITNKLQENGFTIKKLFFMHIAKTAGTSLNNFIVQKYFSDRTWTHIEGNKNWRDESYNSIPKRYDFISGHVTIQRFKRIVNLSNFFKITLIRDPIKHLASHLNWVISISDDIKSNFFLNHPLHIRVMSLKLRQLDFSNADLFENFVNKMTIEERVLFDNCQSRYFLNNHSRENLVIKDLEEVFSTVELFDIIGVSDKYDDFIKLVAKEFEWDIPEMSKKRLNVQNNRVVNFDLKDKKITKIVARLTWLDQKLYDKIHARYTY